MHFVSTNLIQLGDCLYAAVFAFNVECRWTRRTVDKTLLEYVQPIETSRYPFALSNFQLYPQLIEMETVLVAVNNLFNI